MDLKELYCNSIMPNLNGSNYLFPYFASKENQTIYVMVPTANPIPHQLNENLNEIKISSSEEEILSDFRCKICSVTMFNYSEFKIHQQGHEKITQKILKKSGLADRIKQLRNLKNRPKSDISKNIENSTVFEVPTTNPTVPHQLSKNFDEIKNCSSEEEISSDFRCEICSVTIFNYSEFKIHQQSHERITQETLNKSMLADGNQQLISLRCRLKSSISKNITNSTVFSNPKHKNYLHTTVKNTNPLLKTEILPNSSMNKHGGSSFSNKSFATFGNSNSTLNSVQVSTCSKSDELLNIQNKASDLVLKNHSFPKSPGVQALNKCGDYDLTSKLPSDTKVDLSPFKNVNLGNSVLDNEDMSSELAAKLHFPDISKDEVVRKLTSMTNYESKTSDTGLISTGQPLNANNGKKIVSFLKTSDSSTLQSHIEALNTKTNTQLVNSSSIGIICKSQVEKNVSKSTGTFKRILPASQTHQRNVDSFRFSSDPKNLTSVKKSTKNEEVEYNDNNLLLSPNSIILKKSSDADFPRHFFQEDVNQITNKLNSSQVSFKVQGNMNSYAIEKDSKFEKTSENSNRNKEVDTSRSKTSKIKNMKLVKARSRSVSILKPLNEKAKKFKCFYCTMQFNSCYQKRKHLIQHKETKSTYCVLCKSSFSSAASLRKHMLMVHCKSKNRKKCSYCNYRCFQNSDLDKHIARRHTRDFRYKCSFCTKGYTTPKELKIHVGKKH